jgi:hypothetical protein
MKIPNEAETFKEMIFTENEILEHLDLAFYGIPSDYYPKPQPGGTWYSFFLDLEHGYCDTAGSRIHLYADLTRWAVVCEKSGYFNRATRAEIELNYVGNCINYSVQEYPEGNCISNSSSVILVDGTEFKRIENTEGPEMELIGQDVKEINVRDKLIPFDNNYRNYEKFGIEISEYNNPRKLIGFEDFVRYLHETSPDLIKATDDDIRQHIPNDIPKLMTIDEFHFSSIYNDMNPPSKQEIFNQIAKILVTRDVTNWKPTQEPNNSWKNWESGHM